ncbi:MAG TPA: amidophosphoribosyltransferase [Candidatus Methanoculleus thermohydrogenotrophicum]|jgi:amidophosphoribosyltransferase|nr:amidophosphoribosyltransferase [Candidatus Methanoculleus thermohydrogenotrophicum]NLM81080.1 amidophosphoribosyltransferase [Candidatus Methanoculleus thermohydrogenotrophicum]HOB17178.1 amidophosphoribosyltransferase [Candidatus Methanoculleus thermohydrogenotrophicum]HPZ37257.1 amidophosphoribosyltransferase [Candidatus Methanoculleus thermohydrogenotrophicum]HQC90529.1 amidophosphoribosyltransferase [Candidatus Methanoculleus thermohydrogenotrophicum]
MCGIVGIVDAGGVSFPLYYALYALQHRGQESAGISTFEGTTLYTYKAQGLVAEVFNSHTLEGLHGNAGIGHVRYPVSGSTVPENVQPFNFRYRGLDLSIAHNGNLVNAAEIREEYERRGQIFCTATDAEVIGNIIAEALRTSKSMEDAVRLCMRRLRGSYAIVALLNNTVYAFRDPLGITPLCVGKLDHGYIIASESVAIDALGGMFIRDVRPGELIHIDENGFSSVQIATANRTAHCIFEYIYFARADSVIDGTLVYDVRRRIGQGLHDAAPVRGDMVCPVPDSGTAYAAGYAEQSGIPFLEGLMKNRYMGRTFIMPTQQQREWAIRIKLNTIRGNLKGKRVILVDDSIVRGTTSRRIVKMIREAGASEIHLRVGSPPIISPCYLGVDMPTRAELIASGKSIEMVRESIGATSLAYIPLKDLVEAIGCDERNLCTGCLTGCYPVDISEERCHHSVVDYMAGTHHQAGLSTFRTEKQRT